MITYRKATPEDVLPALELALRVFMEYEVPEYEPEGVAKFKADIKYKMANLDMYASEMRLMFIAVIDEKIVGVIEARDKENDGHVNLLFVDGEYHRQGIATALMERMVCALKLRGHNKITVYSSPYGLPFYSHFGFMATDSAQHKDGFIFTPMEYTPNEIWDILDANGNKTGRFHERGRPMAAGDYHLAVHVWKHNGRGEWLIDKRTPEKGGKWETTGGAATAGDDSLTTALRETKEEVGLNLDSAKGTLFWQFANHVSNEHRCLIDVWVFEHDCAASDIHFQKRETCEAMWATAEQIRRLIRNNMFFSDVNLYFDEMVDKWRAAK